MNVNSWNNSDKRDKKRNQAEPVRQMKTIFSCNFASSFGHERFILDEHFLSFVWLT